MDRSVPRMALLGWLGLLVPAALGAEPPGAGPAGGARADAAPYPAALLTGPDETWLAPDAAVPAAEARPLARRVRSSSPASPGASPPASSSAWGRTTLSLAGVVGLIVLLGWGYRAVAGGGGTPRWSLRGRYPALIELVSRTNLSPRQSLCLVRIGPRLVLVGVTPNAMRALDVIQDADLTARLLGQASAERADSSSAEFARCLEAVGPVCNRSSPAPPAETETDASERTLALQARLADTLQRLRATAARA